MTDTPHLPDHHLMAERDRLRTRIAELEARPTIVVARGIEALQNTSGLPSSDWEGCVE